MLHTRLTALRRCIQRLHEAHCTRKVHLELHEAQCTTQVQVEATEIGNVGVQRMRH